MALTLVSTSYRPPQPPDCGFNSHDLIALTCWMQRADGHGYQRMLIERGSSDEGPAAGGYVLIYAPGSQWATWGLARTAGAIVVWRCSDGADLGRFPSMMLALEGLPPVLAPGLSSPGLASPGLAAGLRRTAPARKVGRLPKPLRAVPRFSEGQPG